MVRKIKLLIILFLFCSTAVWGAEKKTTFTQKDFAVMLLKQFAWDAGLPKEPIDRDYLIILGGKREFRYEAENAYNPATDNLSVAEYELFGPFTGKGWLLGISTQTKANFTIIVPIAGEYTLKATMKGKGFVWKTADKELRADVQGDKFKEVEVGKLILPAGSLQLTATLPPEGAIDSFSLIGAEYPAAQPFAGWRFKEACKASHLAEAAVSMTNRFGDLPYDQSTPVASISAAESLPPVANVTATDTQFLGTFTSKKWLRSDFRGATIQLPFTIEKSGFYQIAVRVLGESITGNVNGVAFEKNGKPFLNLLDLGHFRLEAGNNLLTLKLPPMGGIDILQLTRKDTSAAAFMKIAGIDGAADRLVTQTETQAFIKALQEKFPIRK